jgi:cell division transport system permease protein
LNINNFFYFLKETISNFKKNSLMTFASLSTVAITLTIFGSYLLLLINIQNLAKNISSQLEINAYLKPGLEKEEIELVATKFRNLEGVRNVKIITKEEALKLMQKRMGGELNIEDILEENPLPDSLQIKVDSAESVFPVVKKIKKNVEIDEVVYSQELINKIKKIFRVLGILGLITVFLLAVGTTILILNTIRLTVFARRKEIKIMQLVGATNWFIRWPFLLEGIFHGIGGALLSSIVILFSYPYVVSQFKKTLPFFPVVSEEMYILKISFILLSCGIFLGTLGGLLGVGKFLSED